ncbi:hypothetical protein HZQ94_08955 [Elizabethkingia anophelis]|uniref:hypothetical protein n=1 Tax=Elizabethkingia anophelis TaxID=1117645 RepID=UPI0021A52391|nr:hypothetical protein [Elizabethkingia anophelis]MCT3680153.1 hypothetical protein [Elizabethkingia anophelis]
MKRLEEIREEYAKTRGFESWEHLNGDCLYDNDLDAIATIYAREVAQASLEKAAEKLLHFIDTYNADHSEIKLEITDEQNIVML